MNEITQTAPVVRILFYTAAIRVIYILVCVESKDGGYRTPTVKNEPQSVSLAFPVVILRCWSLEVGRGVGRPATNRGNENECCDEKIEGMLD